MLYCLFFWNCSNVYGFIMAGKYNMLDVPYKQVGSSLVLDDHICVDFVSEIYEEFLFRYNLDNDVLSVLEGDDDGN